MKIGYKKVKQGDKDRILKLEILGRVVVPYRPFSSKIQKKRTSKVRVLEAFSVRVNENRYSLRLDKKLKSDGPYLPYHHESHFYKRLCRSSNGFKYFVGKIAVPANGLNTDKHESCGAGINYFSTLGDALGYIG